MSEHAHRAHPEIEVTGKITVLTLCGKLVSIDWIGGDVATLPRERSWWRKPDRWLRFVGPKTLRVGAFLCEIVDVDWYHDELIVRYIQE